MNTSLRFLIIVTIVVFLSACTSSQPTTAPIGIETFEEARAIFKEIREAEDPQAQARADQLWQTLVDSDRVPLVLDTQVIFLYKGDSTSVSWSGSFNHWSDPGLEGLQLGKTDLWIAYAEFPEASRVEYKIILDGDTWVNDPVNPRTTFSGLTGSNNVIALPGFTVTDESTRRDDIEHGMLTKEGSMESRSLGYRVNYWVYTPPGYEEMQDLSAIYVLDGNDFVDERMGALPNILDNMIADGRIEPIIVVFINQRDPANPEFNRREQEFLVHPVEHANFVAEELVSVIDSTYRTAPDPKARVIMGVSYGGLSSLYIGSLRSDVFHNVAAFSPSLWAIYSPGYLPSQEHQDGSATMKPTFDALSACGGETEVECLPLNIFATAGWPDWDVGSFDMAVVDLQHKGYTIEFHSVREGHTWDHWRGLSDEMLMYFFGVD